ncbi:zinc finger CCCH domain-containing protein 18-like [Penaeus monodon]|uniref:zinc finger CCCH domain-containing protein 18-like n=1 Tax=Penaeus monodon TaxID=6687 RepID=UPI0018A6EBDB|nr:zinc finger CCCH domain-containing protein 18-like [Penaeus monodon]
MDTQNRRGTCPSPDAGTESAKSHDGGGCHPARPRSSSPRSSSPRSSSPRSSSPSPGPGLPRPPPAGARSAAEEDPPRACGEGRAAGTPAPPRARPSRARRPGCGPAPACPRRPRKASRGHREPRRLRGRERFTRGLGRKASRPPARPRSLPALRALTSCSKTSLGGSTPSAPTAGEIRQGQQRGSTDTLGHGTNDVTRSPRAISWPPREPRAAPDLNGEALPGGVERPRFSKSSKNVKYVNGVTVANACLFTRGAGEGSGKMGVLKLPQNQQGLLRAMLSAVTRVQASAVQKSA